MPAAASTPSSTERLFIAATLPEAVRAALASLPEEVAGIAWTPFAQLHLTLRFLGDVPADRIDALIERLAKVQVEPFVLPVASVGSFPPNRAPRVLWVGTGQGHPRLFQLRQRIDDAALAAGVDFDVRTFHPHITLARCGEAAATAATHWLHGHRDFEAPPFRVEAFDLYASELRREGAVHTVKHHFPLTG